MIDLGKAYRRPGAHAVAQKMFEAAIGELRQTPGHDPQHLASALGNLAALYYEDQQYGLADQTYAEALEAIRDAGPLGERPWLLHNRAMLKYHLGEHGEARQLYEEAKRLWSEEHGTDHPFVATTAANLALLHWAQGDAGRALDCFAEAETLRDHEMQRVLAV